MSWCETMMSLDPELVVLAALTAVGFAALAVIITRGAP